MKLIDLTESPLKTKKYRAFFDNGKHTDFGAKGYDDFTISKDPEQAKRYKARHEKDLKTNDPTRAGFLSYYILWSAPTLLKGVKNYQKILSKYNI
jgi:hypothetical protein